MVSVSCGRSEEIYNKLRNVRIYHSVPNCIILQKDAGNG
jgi:hypothetical protein